MKLPSVDAFQQSAGTYNSLIRGGAIASIAYSKDVGRRPGDAFNAV